MIYKVLRHCPRKIGKPAGVIVLKCTRDTAQRRFLRRGREKSDDEKRFEKSYGEYVENMKAVCEHYRSVIETVCIPFLGIDRFISHLSFI